MQGQVVHDFVQYKIMKWKETTSSVVSPTVSTGICAASVVCDQYIYERKSLAYQQDEKSSLYMKKTHTQIDKKAKFLNLRNHSLWEIHFFSYDKGYFGQLCTKKVCIPSVHFQMSHGCMTLRAYHFHLCMPNNSLS